MKTGEDNKSVWCRAAKPFSASHPNIFNGVEPKHSGKRYLLLLLCAAAANCLGKYVWGIRLSYRSSKVM